MFKISLAIATLLIIAWLFMAGCTNWLSPAVCREFIR